MANLVNNKAGIQPIPTDRYIITGSDIIKYLQDQLGFGVGHDFTRWTGVSPDLSYVRMRVIFAPKDIVADSGSATDYVERKLAEFSAGLTFKDYVIDTLKPFMYPENINDVRNRPEDLQRLYTIGVFDDRLNEIIQHSKLNYCQEANVFRLYLRPERIIADMLKNPDTGAIDGNMSIVTVYGTSSETIRWDVAVTHGTQSFEGNGQMSIDAVFNQR
jgi:hypothetical protein